MNIKLRKAVLAFYYRLDREVTDQELWDEIKSLKRKRAKGGLDDLDEWLWIALELDDE